MHIEHIKEDAVTSSGQNEGRLTDLSPEDLDGVAGGVSGQCTCSCYSYSCSTAEV